MFYHCHFHKIFHVANFLVFASGLILNCLSLLLILSSAKLRNNRKYGQLIVMNVVSILDCMSFLYYFCYRFFIDDTPSRFLCIFGFQMLGLGFILLQTTLMSLLTECTVAIYFPFKFKSLVSFKRIVACNILIVTSIILFMVVYPCVVFPYRYGSEIVYCTHRLVIPSYFHEKTGYFGFIYFAVNILFCFLIGIGVIKAFYQRKKMLSGKDSKVLTQTFKLVGRLLVIITANYLCLLLLIFNSLGYRFRDEIRDVGLITAISTTTWNVLIFIGGDKGIQNHIRRCDK